MFFDGPAERNRLHARIDELERRLALLEESQRSRPDQAAEEPSYDRRDPSERRFGRRATDRVVRSSRLEESESGREGARLVALEMLEAGYEPEQVKGYLRETFNLDAEGAALAVAGPPPG